MLLCALGSLTSAVIVGYLTSFLSSDFSLNIRSKIFKKVCDFGMEEIKDFHTSSLITRTTNDVTQLEMFIAMGLQMLIKAPIMAVALYFVSELASKDVKVVLSGEGADEFFGGYNTYRQEVDYKFYNKIPF